MPLPSVSNTAQGSPARPQPFPADQTLSQRARPTVRVVDAVQYVQTSYCKIPTQPVATSSSPLHLQVEQSRNAARGQVSLCPDRAAPLPGTAWRLQSARQGLVQHIERLQAARARPAPQAPMNSPSLENRTLPPQSAPVDVLAKYLSNEANRRRFDVAANSGLLIHRDVTKAGVASPVFFTVSSQEPRPAYCIYSDFSSDVWTLDSLSNVEFDCKFSPADIVLSQYLQAREMQGFDGERPRTLRLELSSRSPGYQALAKKTEIQPQDVREHLRMGSALMSLLPVLESEVKGIRLEDRCVCIDIEPRPNASKDFLKTYLRNPAHRDTQQCLKETQYSSTEPVYRNGVITNTGYITSPGDPNRPRNEFQNSYSPNEWRMEYNFRENHEHKYFASDVTLVQYEFISKKHNFYGQLPARIVRRGISNAITNAYLGGSEGKPDLQGFLTKTPNGKHTAHILNALGMTATSLRLGDRDVILDVQPLAAEAGLLPVPR